MTAIELVFLEGHINLKSNNMTQFTCFKTNGDVSE